MGSLSRLLPLHAVHSFPSIQATHICKLHQNICLEFPLSTKKDVGDQNQTKWKDHKTYFMGWRFFLKKEEEEDEDDDQQRKF